MQNENRSYAEQLIYSGQWEKYITSLSPTQLTELKYYWEFWARPKQLPPNWNWQVWMLCAGRGFGKALALDTPIPTPIPSLTGWTTMGELQVGDQVFDERGKPCNVTAVTDVMHGRTCYAVVFNDGTEITADAQHEWPVSIDGHSEVNIVTTETLLVLGSRASISSSLGTWTIAFVADTCSVPVKCIQVDSPSSLYLASKAMIPTHNSRCGAEWVRHRVEKCGAKEIALVGRTAADVRDVMVTGPSGLLAISPPEFRPEYHPSNRLVVWPNGAKAHTYSADEPNVLRGPQHDTAWCDELAAWMPNDSWSNLEMGMRLGVDPRTVVTTTPRPVPLVKMLLARPTTAITVGATFENSSNLAPSFIENIKKQYEGTRLGRQELYAEVLIDNPCALWHQENIDTHRKPAAPGLTRIVIAIDPAVSSSVDSDETGIVVAGSDGTGHAYILHDASGIYTPSQWAEKVVALYDQFEADCIIAETNNGGELVKQNIYTVRPRLPFKEVKATRGKVLRAEPVAALYEQGRVHHVGILAKLEDQMCGWDPTLPGKSPDRLDAMVWAVNDLLIGSYPAPRVPGYTGTFSGVFHGDAGW